MKLGAQTKSLASLGVNTGAPHLPNLVTGVVAMHFSHAWRQAAKRCGANRSYSVSSPPMASKRSVRMANPLSGIRGHSPGERQLA